MKKIIVILCCLFLSACQMKPNTIKTKTHQDNQKKSELILKSTSILNEGNGSEDGYYRIKTNEEGGSYLTYIDYKTAQEVYLCQKPECKHNNENCTAFIPFDLFITEIIPFKEHLYLFSTGNTTTVIGEKGVEDKENPPKIYQMDLDRNNKKELFQLEEGYRLNTDEIIFDDTYLYITAYKNEQISLKDKTEMEIALKTKLYRIHLSSGKYDTIKNTDDETILGVEGRNIIFEGNIYKEDPQKYLNNKDYDKYYSALLNSKKKFEIYNIDTKKSKVIETDEDTIETYYQGSVYWIDHNHVMKLNLKNSKKEILFSLPESNLDYSIYGVISDNLIIQAFDDTDDTSDKMYNISTQTPSLHELHHFTSDMHDPVRIITQTADYLLAIYDTEGKMEKTWAGTMQYEVDKDYYGLISKKDFLNDKKNYKKINTLF